MRRVVLAMGAVGVLLAAGAPAAQGQPGSAARRALTAALNRGMADIGGASGAYVVDLTTGQTLYADNATVERLPASVEKIYTTSTALLLFGPAARLSTSILGVGTFDSHRGWHGTLYLRGGGDPTFGSAAFDRSYYGGPGATMQRLVANLIRATGITSVHGSILGDESYFDSRRGTSESSFRFDPYMTGALSALAYNRGLTAGGSGYILHPAVFAAQRLAQALRAAGVMVPKGTRTSWGRTPSAAETLATVQSPPVATLIRLTNTPSDNFFAEMLLKGLGARFGGAGTTAAGAAVVRREIASRFGIHPRLVDGSGLSPVDATSPIQVVTALRDLYGNRYFWSSLAIGGETGTLQYEMTGTAAQGNCRGKTGTLHDVASLAGYCEGRDGHTLAFAFLANSISDPAYVHQIEGNVMAPALARYDG